ncbi:MAG: hypothetical protein EXR09_04795 [Acetobacteraceae bacterium]|nr:hypothetical protein [Acetobacteraceae bacterium]
MRAVGVAGVLRHCMFDLGARGVALAGFIEVEGVLAVELPIVAVLGGEAIQQGHLFLFTPGAAGEADEAEDGGAGAKHHGIAGLGFEVFPGGHERCVPLAGEDEVIEGHVAGLARSEMRGRGAGMRHRRAADGRAPDHHAPGRNADWLRWRAGRLSLG